MISASDSSTKRPLEITPNETDIEAVSLSSPITEKQLPELKTEGSNSDENEAMGYIEDYAETERLLVWWQEPADKDPENPLNWPTRRKYAIIGTLSFITFLT